jgi:LssY C-terminus
MESNNLCIYFILTSVAAIAAELPPGTTLSVRQQVTVGTRFSKVGDAVNAVLLAPVLDQGHTILPVGSELEGIITMVQKVGLGFKYQAASLALGFHSIRFPNGKEVLIDTRMRRVETAREWVDSDGRIHGIGSVTNVSSSLAADAWRLIIVAPGVGVSVLVTKLLFAPAPDTEIMLVRGTEYRLQLVQPLKVEDADIDSSGRPTSLLSLAVRRDTRAAMDALPSQRAQRVSGASADLVNLILVGSVGSVTRAFQAAGWATSDVKSAASVIRTYFSIMSRTGYDKAPMATMVLDGNRSDFALEKSLDTFARRHHLRIWLRPQETHGEHVWVATATEDVGIKFSTRALNFAHTIDGNVDGERTKVVDDLLYTGCVSEAGLVERNDLPTGLENGTGTKLETDGRVAVLRIGECAEPRVMPGVGVPERTGFLKRVETSVRSELIRSNFFSLAYNGARLTWSTRRFLFRRPILLDDTAAKLTHQQVDWLAEKPAGPGVIPDTIQ